MRRNVLILVVAASLLSACGKNFDAQCAALFEDMTKEFDDILEEDSQDKVVERLKNLKNAERIIKLRDRAQRRVSEKISSGEIWSDLNPDAGPRPKSQRIVIEGVDRRKVVAMNTFNQRWFRLDQGVRYDAGWNRGERNDALTAISDLQVACNHKLR